jgi:hypothetical protein
MVDWKWSLVRFSVFPEQPQCGSPNERQTGGCETVKVIADRRSERFKDTKWPKDAYVRNSIAIRSNSPRVYVQCQPVIDSAHDE